MTRAQLALLALAVADEAAQLAAKGHRSRPHADEKGRSDLVTAHDRASEALIFRRLAELAPGIPIVGEESSGPGLTQPREGLAFYVDPIDGTTNFVHGHPFWCVSVGLAEDDVPVAGAVVAPMLNLRWSGWVGTGGAPGEARRNSEPCRVSGEATLRHAMLATGFPPQRDHAPENNFDAFAAVKRAAQAVRRCGSAAVDLCLVADGTYDGYWERALHAWDVVAGVAIVRAAGGRVTALDGGPPRIHEGQLAATNGLVHDALLGVIHT